ncbi:MAG: hypothetical protein RR396_05395, partial [Clostridiales bacterium]
MASVGSLPPAGAATAVSDEAAGVVGCDDEDVFVPPQATVISSMDATSRSEVSLQILFFILKSPPFSYIKRQLTRHSIQTLFWAWQKLP